MTAPVSYRGGALVSTLADLGAVEIGAIYYLRQWQDGATAQSAVWNDFATALGPDQGRKVLKVFETLCSLWARHGRRPLVCHKLTCKCVGADEACFANFIGYASEGAREDALLMAINLVRPDMAFVLVGLAEDFGMALKRITTTIERFEDVRTQPAVYH